MFIIFCSAVASADGPFAIMRMSKIKSIRAGNKTKEHNARKTPCYSADPKVSNQRVALNKEMQELNSKSFKEIFDERTKGQKIRKNAVYGVECVMTFTPGSITKEQLPEWRNKSIAWFCSVFSKENIIDCVFHLDEATPHIHIIAIPIDRETGKLNAKAFLNGTGRTFERFQDEYAAAMSEFGLKRGVSKKLTKAYHKSSQQWHIENTHKEAELKAHRKFKAEQQLTLDDEIKFNKYYNEFLNAVSGNKEEAKEEIE